MRELRPVPVPPSANIDDPNDEYFYPCDPDEATNQARIDEEVGKLENMRYDREGILDRIEEYQRDPEKCLRTVDYEIFEPLYVAVSVADITSGLVNLIGEARRKRWREANA